MKKEIMSQERREKSLATVDLSDPKNGVHAINLVVAKVNTALQEAYPEAVLKEVRTDPIVPIKENYDDLLFPADNAGRSSRYTRYVDEMHLLRTHTSAAIPGWLKQAAGNGLCDTIVSLPGMCYRRDVVDKTHCAEPHQMDVWRIRKNPPGTAAFNRDDLINLVETILNAATPGYGYRTQERKHPYTQNGMEVQIYVGNDPEVLDMLKNKDERVRELPEDEGWLEVLECGEAHPTVLKNAGLDPEEYSGLALGMGLDRLVMLVKKIEDIRVLRSPDPRIVKQLQNLDEYTPVSNQQWTERVVSYSASADKSEEDTCEAIMDHLGENARYVEEIIYEEVAYGDLHPNAVKRLGIKPDQKNIIAKVRFRSLEGTLGRKMVNAWMQDLYPKVNEGDSGYM